MDMPNFMLTCDAQQYMLFDHYCVTPRCSCVDAIMSCVRLNAPGHSGDDVAAYRVGSTQKIIYPGAG